MATIGGKLGSVDSEDLEPRVAALEDQVRELAGRVDVNRQDAAAARVLAGAADRDVGEIRGELRDFRKATTASFNAMRQDFVDLRDHVDKRFEQVDQRFELVNQRFDHVDQRFDHVDRGFTEMRGKFDATAAGLQEIVDLLQTIITDR